MLKNYLKIALRNILRNKVTSAISILGFAVGFTIALYIFLFVKDEFTFDRYHKEYNKIFEVVLKSFGHKYANIPPIFSEKAVLTFPQFQYSTKVLDKEIEVKNGQTVYKESVTFAEPDFFKMFSFEVIKGNIEEFNNLTNIVITKSASKKYFGNESPIGKILSVKIEGKYEGFIVAALINDPPENSSLKPFIIIPYQNAETISTQKYSKKEWSPAEFEPYFFVKLKNVNDAKFINLKLSSLVPSEVIKRYDKMNYCLIPIKDIHFSNDINFSSIKTANIQTSFILCGLGILILIIISSNFINLSMGNYSCRVKEIGIRKTIGADKKQIFLQFISESIVTVMISFFISLFLSSLFMHSFNAIVGKKLNLIELLKPFDFMIIILSLIIVGLIAGIYPALLLSKMNTINILKGEKKLSGPKLISKIFIAQQFVITVFLFIGAVIINLQYNYIIKKDIGVNKENTIVIKTSELFGRRLNEKNEKIFKEELLHNSLIISASCSDMILGGSERLIPMNAFGYRDKHFFSYIFNLDQNGKESLGLKLTQGRFFNDNISADSSSLVVNETFVKAMGTKNALNETVSFLFKKPMTIIGVVADFNYKSLKEKITPTVFYIGSKVSMSERIYIRYRAGNVKLVLALLKNIWIKYFPDMSLEYYFLDEKIDNLYKEENKWTNIINYSSVTAVVFACMGLFGLTLFSTEKRTKEIGIRKILGASTWSILKLVIGEYAALIAIATTLAILPAYYFGERWLQDFAYRIEISWWIFALSGGIALLIALLTVSYQAIKAATANPVESLRYE